jgi:hypothetical protein
VEHGHVSDDEHRTSVLMSLGFGFGFPKLSALAGGFSPASLFTQGEQGAWYDPADLTTLFQDSAGTTPVTAVEQPVGLMLDKSKGLVLGSELFSTFGTVTSPWAAQGGGVWSIDGSQAGSRDLSQSAQYAVGSFYVTRFTLSGVTGGSVTVFAGEGAVGPTYGNGTFTIRSYSSQAYLIFRAPAGVAATVSGVSVKALPGNHAFQTTSAKRPVLSGRVNLLTKTEDFADGAWTKQAATVAQNAVGPNGVSNTATTLTASAGSGNHWLFQGSTVAATPITCAVYAKAGTANWLGLSFGAGATTDGAFFNLANGAVGAVAFGSTAAIQTIGNGWYFCTVTRTPSIATTYFNAIEVHTANNQAIPWTAAGTETLLIWGADLRVTNTGVNLPPYQRVNTSTDYDTSGFPLYLKYDGVDDAMATNTVDFSATDKMTVWAGVRKLSDAAQGHMLELSFDSGSNNGTFLVAAPRSSGAENYRFFSRGTLNADSFPISGYVSPITNVLTGVGNISAPEATLRINAAVAATSSASQGTGNYGNYPLFIGARNQTSLYFNGNIYSLIIRGAQSTTPQISATESWVNQRTAAY